MASCCICYSVFKSSDILATTRCGHVFHQACIQTWFSTGTSLNNQTCPNCRCVVGQGLLRRLHLNFEEEMTQNNSIINELQKNNISMEDELKKMKRQLAAVEKKNSLLLKSKNTYQQRAAKLKEDYNELKVTNKNLKKELAEEHKKCKFYQNEYIALSAQIDELQSDW